MGKRFASIFLYKKSGEFLLQHRTDDAPRNPGFWSIFGGGIEEGESPFEAVIREIKEELDYDLKNPELLFVFRA